MSKVNTVKMQDPETKVVYGGIDTKEVKKLEKLGWELFEDKDELTIANERIEELEAQVGTDDSAKRIEELEAENAKLQEASAKLLETHNALVEEHNALVEANGELQARMDGLEK